MNYFDVLQGPLLSEKAYRGLAGGVYTFWVHPSANRTQVKNAVQQAFGVKVAKVNVLNVRGKHKRVGRFEGTTNARKKAIVTLAAGQKIELFEGLIGNQE
jgi:large subunit ribosomal protein L23